MNAPAVPPFFTGTTQPEDQQFDAWPQQPLLLSMEAGGIDWPSSCRNGTCRTCFGKLERGQVRYEIEWPGLSAEEKAEGYVLPCVAHPCTDVVLRAGY
ncbi:2Fe-2S iron-sulfur cluster-binding protein [Rhodoferax sp.]|uniref:2Fe-2S iron-sulfur cluster-binding protein n=1 Tax=Rhodoferax sp. TaxID=50421 RepID=UPI002607FE25|nr:2Fe-2S iron-sulfur cluster-binding protein [Rhodoferax sp.]MDD2925827.1 2Fe-2S iron-sulfur cluster-binding protein [Rhodoferax sp.]